MATHEPIFYSNRLIYYKLREGDLDGYTNWYTSETSMKYVTLKALTVEEAHSKFAKKMEENKKYECPQMGVFSVTMRDNSKTFIGLAHLTYTDMENKNQRSEAEVGYGLLPDFWGKGYATEILGAVLKVAKEIKITAKLNNLIAEVHPDNGASIKILVNQGFTLYKSTVEDDEPIDHYKYSL